MQSTFGKTLKITISGESHGEQISVRMQGFPADEAVDLQAVEAFLRRRAPGNDPFSTTRKESDKPEVLSGIVNDATDGGIIEAIIRNQNQHSTDYDSLRFVPRPSHADYPARAKYGDALDLRGGGHFSGRLTAPLCFAGAVCLQYLARRGIYVGAHIAQIAEIKDDRFDAVHVSKADFDALHKKPFCVINSKAGAQMQTKILAARGEGDSVGGVIEVAVIGLPVGLGTPLYDGLESRLAANFFGIPAVKGIDFGSGFDAVLMRGSQHNDAYTVDPESGEIRTLTNHAGGCTGAITNGMPIILRAAFKPTPSIAKTQQSVDLQTKEIVELNIKGRHDPCIVPRALPVAEAMAAITVTDLLLEDAQ